VESLPSLLPPLPAGLVKAVEQGLVDPDEQVVVLATGSGLKDIASAMKSVGEPHLIEPTMDSLRRQMASPAWAGASMGRER